METQFNFEKLMVYQKTEEFIVNIYNITSSFPESERFGLISQFRRAASSIALNIGEGSGNTKSQFIRYLNISKGSLRECVVCLNISFKLGYLNKNTQLDIRIKLIEIAKMLSGLISSQQKI